MLDQVSISVAAGVNGVRWSGRSVGRFAERDGSRAICNRDRSARVEHRDLGEDIRIRIVVLFLTENSRSAGSSAITDRAVKQCQLWAWSWNT